MAYVKAVDFAAKDVLLTGNPAKLIKGTEIGAEFDAIAAATAAMDANLTAHTGAAAGAHAATAISNTPAGAIAATTVQAAINELDTEKAPIASPTFTGVPAAPTATSGTATTQLATTAFATNQDLGVGQTWQDFTATNTSGTPYTNSTGKPIQVNVTAQGNSTGVKTITAVVDGITVDTGWTAVTATVLRGQVSFIVPSGSTYSVTFASATISNWAELR